MVVDIVQDSRFLFISFLHSVCNKNFLKLYRILSTHNNLAQRFFDSWEALGDIDSLDISNPKLEQQLEHFGQECRKANHRMLFLRIHIPHKGLNFLTVERQALDGRKSYWIVTRFNSRFLTHTDKFDEYIKEISQKMVGSKNYFVYQNAFSMKNPTHDSDLNALWFLYYTYLRLSNPDIHYDDIYTYMNHLFTIPKKDWTETSTNKYLLATNIFIYYLLFCQKNTKKYRFPSSCYFPCVFANPLETPFSEEGLFHPIENKFYPIDKEWSSLRGVFDNIPCRLREIALYLVVYIDETIVSCPVHRKKRK